MTHHTTCDKGRRLSLIQCCFICFTVYFKNGHWKICLIVFFQLENFRTAIYENDASNADNSMDISDDFRPVQCLFRRRIYASHPDLKFAQYQVEVDESMSGTATLPVTSVLVSGTCLLAFLTQTYI